MEVKLGDKSLNFHSGSPGKFPGKFPGKRKSPSDYRREQRRKNHPGKEMPTPGNHGAQNGKFPVSSSPPSSRTVP